MRTVCCIFTYSSGWTHFARMRSKCLAFSTEVWDPGYTPLFNSYLIATYMWGWRVTVIWRRFVDFWLWFFFFGGWHDLYLYLSRWVPRQPATNKETKTPETDKMNGDVPSPNVEGIPEETVTKVPDLYSIISKSHHGHRCQYLESKTDHLIWSIVVRIFAQI